MSAPSRTGATRRWKPFLYGGAAALVLVLAGATGTLLHVGEQAARDAAQRTLERSAQSVENTLNRHLLQVDGSLASLPNILSALSPAVGDVRPDSAGRLLRELNSTTYAFRDLVLLGPDGKVRARARPRSRAGGDDLPSFPANSPVGAAVVLGPGRNRLTGDWALYLGRKIGSGASEGYSAVAEMPADDGQPDGLGGLTGGRNRQGCEAAAKEARETADGRAGPVPFRLPRVRQNSPRANVRHDQRRPPMRGTRQGGGRASACLCNLLDMQRYS